MKVSARAEYACLAVLELAMRYGSPEPVRIRRIAVNHGIPHGFLVQILQQLKSAGYVSSTRGSAGGYQLAQAPDRISLAQVLSAIDGPQLVDYDLASSQMPPALRALRSVWQQTAEQVQRTLGEISFADLVECARGEPSMPVVGDWI
jgi:Rrf2 family cysteine metabolism transcriptional repressor